MSPGRLSLSNSHEGFVIGCNFLDMNVALGLDERFTSTEAVAAGDHRHHVLVFAHGLHFDLPLSTVCVADFDHARELRRIQHLCRERERRDD